MKLLVAIDGSKPSLKALERALAFSQRLAEPATITLINVHNDSFIRRHQHQVGKQAIDEYLAELHGADLDEACALLDARQVRYDVVRASGDLATTIAGQAASGGYDLLVVGSQGRGSLTDLVMGSVTTKLLAVSKVPVLVVP